VNVVPQRPASSSSDSAPARNRASSSLPIAAVMRGASAVAKLERQPQIWVSRRERDDGGSQLGLQPAATQKCKLPSPGLEIATSVAKRVEDHRDQPREVWCLGREAPGRAVGILEHDPTAGRDKPKISVELLLGPPQRCNLEPRVDKIE
jgi:hypothetical protein